MPSLLDLGGLTIFQRVWPFLLVMVTVYAILGVIEPFKDNKAVRALIAFVMAVLTLLYPIAWKTINLSAPWFVLFGVFIMFILIAYQMFGVSQEKIAGVFESKNYGTTVIYWTLAIILIIALGSLASVVSQEKKFTSLSEGGVAPTEGLPAGTTTGQAPVSEEVGFFATITHPKVLGLALVLLIAFFTISNLAEK
jgi:hypothetical protein